MLCAGPLRAALSVLKIGHTFDLEVDNKGATHPCFPHYLIIPDYNTYIAKNTSVHTR